MAIARLSPDAVPPINVTTPDTIEAPVNSIFTALVPEARIVSLLKYVEGYPWTVNYYGQLLNGNNSLEQFDPSSPNLTQPYYKILGLIMQVSSPLSSSYSQETGVTTITGSSIMPFGVKPNTGDLFITQVDTGEDALFHITTVTRKTHRKESLYEVTYSLHSYASDESSAIGILEGRVNETYYFNKDTNFFNRDVLIKPSVQEAKSRLESFMHESIPYYLKRFIQQSTGSLLVPGADRPLYDPLLTNFIAKTVDYSHLTEGRYFRPTYSSDEIDQRSIWDCLISRSVPHPNALNKTYNFIPSNLLPIRARLGTLSLTGVSYILYPTDPDLDIKVGPVNPIQDNYVNTIKTERNYYMDPTVVVKTTNNDTVYDKILLHELFEDDYYVLSKNFYDYLTDNSTYSEIGYIELMAFKFLTGKAIAKEDIVVAVQTYKDWSPLHQFYLLPLMWLISRANM